MDSGLRPWLGCPLPTDLNLLSDYTSPAMTLAWLLTTSLLSIHADPGLPSDYVLEHLPLTVCPYSLCAKLPRSSTWMLYLVLFWCTCTAVDCCSEATTACYLITSSCISLCTCSTHRGTWTRAVLLSPGLQPSYVTLGLLF